MIPLICAAGILLTCACILAAPHTSKSAGSLASFAFSVMAAFCLAAAAFVAIHEAGADRVTEQRVMLAGGAE